MVLDKSVVRSVRTKVGLRQLKGFGFDEKSSGKLITKMPRPTFSPKASPQQALLKMTKKYNE